MAKKSIMTPESVEQALAVLRPQHERILADYPTEFGSLPVKKRFAVLAAENKQLRAELGRLNEYISFLIDYRRACNRV